MLLLVCICWIHPWKWFGVFSHVWVLNEICFKGYETYPLSSFACSVQERLIQLVTGFDLSNA